ncbi:MAG: hypothetical protein AVDCRST_MAG30-37 [uncultured Solirubrobacteraceae bacterium]|uniref:Uncharacterized protein n=1 Tax=uncultured Solirubrobacteraceae bacterium TaxID=1162706 RepID=A0A6J4RMD8_9ACTN|nr:MAG: hypothetical protein AVDCRST_MAG30-37 [uncultured Solirubrobacteraceae bacterium]
MLRDLGRADLAEGHGDLRGAVAQDARRLVARRRPDGRADADPHRSGEAAPDRPGALERGVGGGERLAAGVEERLARRRQAHLARRALEQGDAELALEQLHGLRHALLTEVQPLPGAGEVELLGHRDERPQLAQLRHPRRPRRRVVA